MVTAICWGRSPSSPGFQGQPVEQHSNYRSGNDAISLRVPIFRKQLFAQYRQAKALVEDAEAQLERDEQNLVMRVTEAYFNALFAQEQLTLVRVQKGAFVTQLDAARKLFAAGSGTRTDIDEAQARLDMTVAQELEATQQVDISRRQLQVLINAPITGELAPVSTARMQLQPPTPGSIDEWTLRAEAASPELVSLNAQVEAARQEVEKARAGHYPTLDAVAQYSRSKSENVTNVNSQYRNGQVGLQLNIPIFQGGFVNSQVREALAMQERAQEKLEELRRDLGVRVHREFRGVTEGVLKVRALEQAVRSAEQLAVSSRRSFEAGARTRLDILNAEQQASSARRDLAQARFTYLLSRVRLKALAGEMKEPSIGEINGWLEH